MPRTGPEGLDGRATLEDAKQSISADAAVPQRVARGARGSLIVASVLLLLGGVGYGLVLSLNRIVTTAGIPVIPYMFWQTLGGALILLLVALLRRRPPPLTGAHLRMYAIMGVMGLGIPWTLLAFVAPKIPAGIVALGLATIPMLTYAVALTLSMDTFRWWRVVGMIVGLAGILLLVLPETSLPSPEMVGWVLIVFLPAVCFTLTIIASERLRPPEGDPVNLSCGLLFAGTLFLLPAMAAGGEWWFFEGSFDRADGAVVLVTFLAAFLWPLLFEIVRLAGSVFFSSVAYIDTLAGVGWGILIFGERHSGWVWGALVLLLFGLFLVNRRGREPRRTPA